MTIGRIAKPFTVAGLAGVISLAAPAVALAEDPAAPAGTTETAPAAGATARITAGEYEFDYAVVYGPGVGHFYVDQLFGEDVRLFTVTLMNKDTDRFVELDGNDGVVFTSSDPGVFSVWKNGRGCAALSAGTVTITATYQGVVLGSVEYEVRDFTESDATGIGFFSYYGFSEGATTKIHAGNYQLSDWTVAWTVDGNFVTGEAIPNVVFTSSDPNVLYINNVTSMIEAHPGTARLTATVKKQDGTEYSISLDYTVLDNDTDDPTNPDDQNPSEDTTEQNPSDQNPGDQTVTDEEKKGSNATGTKDTAEGDGENLAETGDVAFAATALTGLTGAAVAALGVRANRRKK